MQKIKNIEFLRIFLILTIILFHMRVSLGKLHTDFFQTMYDYLGFGRNCVEAFFIISGFFLVLTFKNIGFTDFVKKKYIRLMPAALFSIIVCAIASLFKALHFKFIPDLLAGLLLSNFGVEWAKSSNVALWYSSALFFGLIIFYLIIRFMDKKYHVPMFLALGLGSYLLLQILCNGIYGGHGDIYYGFISVSTLRAFGGIGIGCTIAELYKKYKDNIAEYSPNLFEYVFFSVAEISSFGYLIWWSYFNNVPINNVYFVYGFIVLFICFISKKGLLSKITDCNIWAKLSKYTYSIFVIHIPVIKLLYKTVILTNKNLFCTHPIGTIAFLLLIIILSGILTYHFIEKPCSRYFSSQEGLTDAKNT